METEHRVRCGRTLMLKERMVDTVEIGCGTVGHDEACLCDVVVTEPVEVKYRLTDVLGAAQTVTRLGLGRPWDATSLVALMDGLSNSYDSYRKLSDLQDPSAPWYDEEGKCQLANIRPAVVALLQEGLSMIDMPDTFSVDLEDIVRCLSTNKPVGYWAWAEGDWLFFESIILGDSDWTVAALARQFGLSHNTMKQLIKGVYAV